MAAELKMRNGESVIFDKLNIRVMYQSPDVIVVQAPSSIFFFKDSLNPAQIQERRIKQERIFLEKKMLMEHSQTTSNGSPAKIPLHLITPGKGARSQNVSVNLQSKGIYINSKTLELPFLGFNESKKFVVFESVCFDSAIEISMKFLEKEDIGNGKFCCGLNISTRDKTGKTKGVIIYCYSLLKYLNENYRLPLPRKGQSFSLKPQEKADGFFYITIPFNYGIVAEKEK